jgi:hypothetical protein
MWLWLIQVEIGALIVFEGGTFPFMWMLQAEVSLHHFCIQT